MSGLIRQICGRLNNLTRNICNPHVIRPQVNFLSHIPTPHEVVDSQADEVITKDIIKKVNEDVAKTKDRLFAVVHVAGKQFKVTAGDLIIIEGYWPPSNGDQISLDKILLLGSPNFTLIGRPLIQSGIANVYATVIEKMLSHTKTHFKKKRRKQYMRINFQRIQQTMLRINKIEITGKVNDPPDVTGLEHVVL